MESHLLNVALSCHFIAAHFNILCVDIIFHTRFPILCHHRLMNHTEVKRNDADFLNLKFKYLFLLSLHGLGYSDNLTHSKLNEYM